MADTGFFNPKELQHLIDIKEGMRVADFGSGSGEIAVMFARIVGPDGVVTAIDVLPSAIEFVRARAKHEKLHNIEAIRADLDVPGSSRLPNASQDVVYCANILWQSPEKAKILTEAARVLKSGGVLAAVEWNQKKGLGPPQEARVNQDTLKALIASAGLTLTGNFAAGAYHYGLLAKK